VLREAGDRNRLQDLVEMKADSNSCDISSTVAEIVGTVG
jgi:hypothetical protein